MPAPDVTAQGILALDINLIGANYRQSFEGDLDSGEGGNGQSQSWFCFSLPGNYTLPGRKLGKA